MIPSTMVPGNRPGHSVFQSIRVSPVPANRQISCITTGLLGMPILQATPNSRVSH